MASEDSRYRDRWRRFIVSVIAAIIANPLLSRCRPCSIIWSTDRKRSKSASFAVLSGWDSKNGTIRWTRSRRRFTEKRSIRSLWLSCLALGIMLPQPKRVPSSSRASRDPAAWVTENSCWTYQPSRHTTLRTIEIEKHPSPSVNPTIHSSISGLSC